MGNQKMQKTLIIVGHQSYEHSVFNKKLVETVKDMENVTVHILTKDFDAEEEQKLLLEYDNIILQYPIYWYNTTPLMKSWLDEVLTYGYAYGPNGDKLENKNFALAVTAGSAFDSYAPTGHVGFTLEEILVPMKATLNFTRSNFKGIFAIYDCLDGGSNQNAKEILAEKCAEYKLFVSSLAS